MSETGFTTIVAGRSHWKNIRKLAVLLKRQGLACEVTEGRGLLQRPFWVMGDAIAIQAFKDYGELAFDD